jgi:hypothetical protein
LPGGGNYEQDAQLVLHTDSRLFNRPLDGLFDLGKSMIDQFKDYFRLPSAKELAAKELEMAQRKLLEALSAQEYAKRMGDYHSDRIKRLTAYLKEEA